MDEHIKEKLIKSILEADLIIGEINNNYWNNMIMIMIVSILFMFLIFKILKNDNMKQVNNKRNE